MLRIISFANPRCLQIADTCEAIASPWELDVWRDVVLDLETGKKRLGDTTHGELTEPGYDHTPVIVEYR